MNRNDYLEHFCSLLQLMRFQTTLPVDEIDGGFFWRCCDLLSKSMGRAVELGIISHDDWQEVIRIGSEIKDQYEIVTAPKYPWSEPFFCSDLFRSVKKNDKGYPLKPLQLCSVLEQKIFKGLPALGDSRPVIEPVQVAEPAKSARPVGVF